MSKEDFFSERETDESLRATALELAARDSAVNAVRKAANASAPPYFDGENCVECELEIPPARLALGKWTCIHCQDLIDRKNRR